MRSNGQAFHPIHLNAYRIAYGAATPIWIGSFGFWVFTITALAGCTSTRFYLIPSTGSNKIPTIFPDVRGKGGSASPKTMPGRSPKAQELHWCCLWTQLLDSR